MLSFRCRPTEVRLELQPWTLQSCRLDGGCSVSQRGLEKVTSLSITNLWDLLKELQQRSSARPGLGSTESPRQRSSWLCIDQRLMSEAALPIVSSSTLAPSALNGQTTPATASASLARGQKRARDSSATVSSYVDLQHLLACPTDPLHPFYAVSNNKTACSRPSTVSSRASILCTSSYRVGRLRRLRDHHFLLLAVPIRRCHLGRSGG